jgi:hypothetical protein
MYDGGFYQFRVWINFDSNLPLEISNDLLLMMMIDNIILSYLLQGIYELKLESNELVYYSYDDDIQLRSYFLNLILKYY